MCSSHHMCMTTFCLSGSPALVSPILKSWYLRYMMTQTQGQQLISSTNTRVGGLRCEDRRTRLLIHIGLRFYFIGIRKITFNPHMLVFEILAYSM